MLMFIIYHHFYLQYLHYLVLYIYLEYNNNKISIYETNDFIIYFTYQNNYNLPLISIFIFSKLVDKMIIEHFINQHNNIIYSSIVTKTLELKSSLYFHLLFKNIPNLIKDILCNIDVF